MEKKQSHEKDILFLIRRFNPDKDEKPHWEQYIVHTVPGMTVLDGIHQIKETIDQSLSHRFSCRMGVCGSCAMLINGKPGLACSTQIREVSKTCITVAPLPNFDIIKDLVPDLTPLFEKHHAIKPYIIRDDTEEMNHPTGEFGQTPQELERYLQFSYCIKCGACMASCPTVATDDAFFGPMPLAQAYRYNADTRDEGFSERRIIVGDEHGAFHCHFAGECSRVCPKGVDPAKAVQFLKRSLVLSYLRFLKKHTPANVMKKPSDAKRREGIPDTPPYTVK